MACQRFGCWQLIGTFWRMLERGVLPPSLGENLGTRLVPPTHFQRIPQIVLHCICTGSPAILRSFRSWQVRLFTFLYSWFQEDNWLKEMFYYPIDYVLIYTLVFLAAPGRGESSNITLEGSCRSLILDPVPRLLSWRTQEQSSASVALLPSVGSSCLSP